MSEEQNIGRLVLQEMDRRCRSRHEVLAVAAVSAVCIQLGASDEEADAVWFTIKTNVAPVVPSDLLSKVREALKQVRAERAWLDG